jgi:photosystem II stability/assembly factor-like uncharacterized protein
MTKRTKRPQGKTAQAPQRRLPPRRRPSWMLIAVAALGIVGVVIAVVVFATSGGSKKAGPASSAGLPNTLDYHSLLVSPSDPSQLFLGTHQGLYSSVDGGHTWAAAALGGQDAMNLVRARSSVVWAAGHEVLAKSADDGRTWADVHPAGLPSLDVHGFAVDPRDGETLYAAVAGQGLYRSDDGGASFKAVSKEVGPNVMGLAVARHRRILAGDLRLGLLVSRDGGKSWTPRLRAQLLGLAISPGNPKRILATGPGILLSQDGGRTWKQVLSLPKGAGPVAWVPSAPSTAYVVGFNRRLYRSSDGGETWSTVS